MEVNLIPRDTYLETLDKLRDKQIIKVLTGVRRSGKSTILQLYQNHLKDSGVSPDQIINLNLEDLGLSELTDYKKLYQYLNDKLVKNKINYIFIDEIQNVNHFEKVIDSLFIKNNVDLYLTGSNAFLLSGELATLLSGRYIEIPVYPFSFKEYYQASSQDKQQAFAEYLDKGGFPFAIQLDDENTYISYIQGIINTVLVKDILSRMKQGNASLLEHLAQFITETAGNLITPHKIASTLTSNNLKTSSATVTTYLQQLTSSFLFYKCDRYDIAGKKYLLINSKYYSVDPALRRALLGQKRPNFGSRLENVVYLELKRRGYQVYVGTLGKKEVDFVAIKDGIKKYIQVSLSVQNEKTYQREIAPFKEINDNFDKILLTQDLGNYNDNGIKQINVIDWLLQ